MDKYFDGELLSGFEESPKTTTSRYEQLGYCEYRDIKTGLVASNYIEVMNEQATKIADLESKLEASEKALEDKNKLIIQEDGECLLCGDGYCINNDVAKIVGENKKLKKQLELLDYEKSIKHYSLNRDLANPESEEMQKHLNRYVFKDKFRICCSMCGKTHEYEFKDIKYSDLFNDIYISCKSCPRSLNKLNFPEQAIAFYRTRYDLVCYEKHQDYLSHRNHISAFEEEINQLKQQLAEKDEYIKYNVPNLIEANEMMSKQLAEKEKELNKTRQEFWEYFKSDDKSSLTAIAELEKVKELLEPKYFDKEQINYLTNQIDQQIRVLKGEK